MMNRLMFFGIVLIAFFSCNRKVQLNNKVEDIPFVINCEELIHLPGKGMDSKIGTIVCDDVTLTYDYGRHSNSKPESMIESFSKSFYAYHYSKFFDAVLVEEKLRNVFVDSVQIINVKKIVLDEKYIVNCNDCNATAFLKFNDIVFLYPFKLNDEVAKNHMLFDISHMQLENYYKKIYISKETQSSGVYIAPLGNPRKSRKLNRLSIATSQTSNAHVAAILASVRLK